jgi:hypothetical protein
MEGQVVIDATNDFDPSDLNGRTSSEAMQKVEGSIPPGRVLQPLLRIRGPETRVTADTQLRGLGRDLAGRAPRRR